MNFKPQRFSIQAKKKVQGGFILFQFHKSLFYEWISRELKERKINKKIRFFDIFNKIAKSLARQIKKNKQMKIKREVKSHYRSGLSLIRVNYDSETTALIYSGEGTQNDRWTMVECVKGCCSHLPSKVSLEIERIYCKYIHLFMHLKITLASLSQLPSQCLVQRWKGFQRSKSRGLERRNSI